MRIIAGKWKSRQIAAPRGNTVRPTTDRVRESVFNILENIVDFSVCTVYDMFAGSGAMGIEALSRGAKQVTFIEQSKIVAATLKKNLELLGCENATVTLSDALRFAKQCTSPADIVFADPPYRYPHIEEFAATVLQKNLFTGVFVLEHVTAVKIAIPGFTVWQEKKFGTTSVQLYTKQS
ncbi:MAG TPA: 16S rRNA (guanine(966)-N(2))-methyltransferase RsmD [Candidatus Kapabacteria bacterium]|nr:16S rRNA (guanine(966)-N(2))-methyltransferase RsmD [Candidatus Kapabacteria bacterium]